MAELIMETIMEIEELVAIKKWARLVDVVAYVDPKSFLGKSLYRLVDGIYLQVSPFKDKEFVHSPDAPFVTGVFFIPDDGAARRVSALAIEEDQGAPLTVPSCVLPDNATAEYGNVLAALRRMRPRVCQETAAYRIAKDGKFVHRTIETERYTFYFRGPEHDDKEQPYAVLFKF